MPNYIQVTEREHSRCRKSGCCREEQPAHWVDVRIAEAILDPFERLLANLSELHDENMELEGGMTKHRREEPRCEYCTTIKRAAKTIVAIKDKPL